MRKRKAAIIVAIVMMSHMLGHAAYGDPAPTPPTNLTIPGLTFLHIRSDFDIRTSGGSELHLPPGYFVDEPGWQKLDDEMKRLQNQETRLTAENTSLKQSAAGWQPGWYTLATALAVGLVGGWYIHDKL